MELPSKMFLFIYSIIITLMFFVSILKIGKSVESFKIINPEIRLFINDSNKADTVFVYKNP